jgi:hypothetical protein
VTGVDEAPRPGFADELLARLERDRRVGVLTPAVVKTLAGIAATASVAVVVAGRRRSR